MQRRLNIKLLLKILAGTLVLLTIVHFVHSSQMRRNADAMLRQADRAMEEKAFAKAASLFHFYLDYKPGDTDAIVRYALAMEMASSSFQARFKTFMLLEQVLRRQPERRDIRRKAVQMAIDLGRCEDAIRHLEYLLSTDGDKADLYHQLGWCQEALDQYQISANSFRRAIELDPAQIESHVLLAALLQQRLEQPAEAAKVMDAMVAANPRSWQALLARARYHYSWAALDAAADDVRKAYALDPQQADVLLAGAEMALLQGNLAEARTYVDRGLQLHPKNERLYRSLAMLEMRSDHADRAEACLRRGLKELPASIGLRVQLAEVLLERGEADEPRTLVAWLKDNRAEPGVIDYLQGRLLAAARQWPEAINALRAARDKLGLASEWTSNLCACLGYCYERLGEPDLRLAAYRDAVLQNPGNVPARLELGRALLACHLPVEAALELRPLTKLAEMPPRAWTLLGQALLERYRRQAPDAATLKDLDAVLARIAELTPDAVELPCLRAQQRLLLGDGAGALALLRAALTQRPTEAALWAALAEVHARQGQRVEALAALEQAQQIVGPSLELCRTALRLWGDRPGPEAGMALLRLAKRSAALPGEDKILLYRELADALILAGQPKEGEATLKLLAELLPKDLRSRVALFDLVLNEDRDADAGRILAELRRIEGEEGVLWRAGEAARAIHQARKGDKGQLQLARKRLAEIRERRRDWARAALLEAYVEEADGRLERAMESYRRAIDLGERPPAVVLRVVLWLRDQQRTLEADRVIRQLQDQMPLSRELTKVGAAIALDNHDFKRAADLAGKAVPPNTRDYRDLLWLAQTQWLAGQPLEAEATLRRAIQSTPRIPDVWIALVRHLLRTSQHFHLDAALEEMKKQVPSDRAALTLARCYEAAGRQDQANEQYRKALAESPGDFVVLKQVVEFYCQADRFDRAEPLLQLLLEPTTAAPAAFKVWARRQLALGLAARGQAGDAARALALLEMNAGPKGAAVEDQRARAFVLAHLPERRKEAIALFEQTLGKQALAAEEQFWLAQIYDMSHDDAKAREQMLSLLTFHRDNVQYLSFLVRSLLARGEIDDAQYYLSTVERLEPNSPRTLQLREAFRKAKEAT